MATFKEISGDVCAPLGFTAAGIHSGIRPGKTKPDLALIYCEAECSAAAVYTQNKVQGAPLTVTKQHLQNGKARAILCNSGNANTCSPGGEEFAKMCCGLTAQSLGLAPEDIVIASTGVIGQAMAAEPFEKGVPQLAAALSKNGNNDASQAILTTDTRPKQFGVEFVLSGAVCRIGGMCKGSGMIHPNMATMLAFLTTDVAISPEMLQKALGGEVITSLNQISVDGDTSTNDMAVILASGLAQNPAITQEGKDFDTFCAALAAVLLQMSRALAADGEGATKLLCCHVSGAPSAALARGIAKTVISSSLFKSAMFGADANWGRVLCAIGYAPGDFEVDNISVELKSAAGSVLVCQNSAHHNYSEQQAALVLAESEIDININMGDGRGSGTAWGCDLTYDYVKINGDYRT